MRRCHGFTRAIVGKAQQKIGERVVVEDRVRRVFPILTDVARSDRQAALEVEAAARIVDPAAACRLEMCIRDR